ncbi:MAG TPA: hypothetical protein VHZ50_03005 [Puia sp.]|nr:hypothetical protein [Puia sp.]
MHISDFDMIDSLEKIELLAEKGVLLSSRTDGCFQISLFQMDSFYVEIYYHISQLCIRLIRCFDETSELNPYLDEIDISDLLTVLKSNK